jgi:hypothetical protein
MDLSNWKRDKVGLCMALLHYRLLWLAGCARRLGHQPARTRRN